MLAACGQAPFFLPVIMTDNGQSSSATVTFNALSYMGTTEIGFAPFDAPAMLRGLREGSLAEAIAAALLSTSGQRAA